VLEAGALAVIPTDTIYGLVADAFNKDAVERVYDVKDRQRTKPCIVLVSNASQLNMFGIEPKWIAKAEEYWLADQPTSVAVPVSKRFSYLARDSGYLAFRLPKKEIINSMLQVIGPVIAPSANPEGLPPALSVEEAYEYFADTVELYVDGGELDNPPSKLIRIGADSEVILRG